MSQKDVKKEQSSEKVMTRYDKKVQKRKEEAERAKKQAKTEKIIGIVIAAAIVIALAMIPVKSYTAVHSTYLTVGGHDITRVEFDYYYNLAKNDYLNTYSSYLSYMGLDTTKDFAKQDYSDTMTWKDYFSSLALETIKQNKALIDTAEAEGFTYDTAKDVAAFESSAKEAASNSDVSVARYYKATFGSYATFARIKSFVEDGYYANAYYKKQSDEKAPAEDEIQTYYEENKDTYDSVDYHMTEIAADIPSSTDADGNAVAATEEEIAAAMAEAKTKADAALETIGTDGEAYTGKLKSSVLTRLGDWLFDADRTEGDTTVIEDTDNHKYYALQFDGRYLADITTANIRVIMSTTVAGEDILKEYEEAGATEDAFIALVDKYSEDTYSNNDGGLYKELMSSSLDSNLSEWIFAGHKAGDTTALTDNGSNYVLYYVGDGRPEWQVKISETLTTEAMTTYLTELKSGYEVSDPKGHLAYLKKQAAADSETAPATTEDSETTPATDADGETTSVSTEESAEE